MISQMIRTVIVDDEPAARAAIRSLVSQDGTQLKLSRGYKDKLDTALGRTF